MKIIVYFYNHTFSAMVFGSVNNNIISFNNLILNNIGVNYFNLISHREYLYFKIYECRVYIYIL